MNYDPSLPPLQAGDLLENGKYEIISDTEDAGGFGRIYRAKVRKSSNANRVGRSMAIKEFHIRELDGNMQSRLYSMGLSVVSGQNYLDMLLAQFETEAKVLRRLTHQHDCHMPRLYHSMRQEGGRYYYAMTYVEGPTLTEVIRTQGPMDETTAINYIAQIAKVLYKAHEWDLIHNDVSPNNIMLENGLAVLVDFGNARGYQNLLQRNYQQENAEAYKELTQRMMYIGTPGFAAPEAYAGKPVADVYSLAATLYYLVTGVKPPLPNALRAAEKRREQLERHHVSDTTIEAIAHAMNPQMEQGTQCIRDFLMELPKEIVFDTLINYNDYDYNRRRKKNPEPEPHGYLPNADSRGD